MTHDLASLQTDWMRIARRENNKKRGYLLVNPLQAKHMPVSPSKALALFSQLADLIRAAHPHDRFLVVGFAETATAIGAAVAASLGESTHYVHTTRESLSNCAPLVHFDETHSHAVEQLLYCPMWKHWIAEADHLLFIEDELTTGHTLINIVQALSHHALLRDSLRITAASLLNGMQQADFNLFRDQNIGCHYLFPINRAHLHRAFDQHTWDGPSPDRQAVPSGQFSSIELHQRPEPRMGLSATAYNAATYAFAQKALSHLPALSSDDSILVLGTEECMHPALLLGEQLEQNGHRVSVHATTRSPIEPRTSAGYPLFERFPLPSVYDPSRKTFIYNLAQYDYAIIATDAAPNRARQGLEALAGALQAHTCADISVFHWLP